MKVLPINTKKQRLKIYKKALKEDLSDRNCKGLCVLLRNLTGRTFFDWNWNKTYLYFPEFGEYYNSRKKSFEKLFNSDIEKWRIKVLNRCIKLCEKE